MKKTLTILVLVTMVLLAAVSPALAAGHGRQGTGGNGGNGGGGGQSLFALVGTITEIDGSSITVQVVDGNRFITNYIGGELTVQVSGNTHYYEWYPDGREPITFDEVEVGDAANIRGTVVDGDFIATVVTVDVPCVTP